MTSLTQPRRRLQGRCQTAPLHHNVLKWRAVFMPVQAAWRYRPPRYGHTTIRADFSYAQTYALKCIIMHKHPPCKSDRQPGVHLFPFECGSDCHVTLVESLEETAALPQQALKDLRRRLVAGQCLAIAGSPKRRASINIHTWNWLL